MLTAGRGSAPAWSRAESRTRYTGKAQYAQRPGRMDRTALEQKKTPAMDFPEVIGAGGL